jgi:hypothetical protein
LRERGHFSTKITPVSWSPPLHYTWTNKPVFTVL